MKKTNRIYSKAIFAVSIFILAFSPTVVHAQEYLYDLTENIQLKNRKESKHEKGTGILSLPFFDDFSTLNMIPNENNWMDKGAFVNDDFALNQPTIGVVTLDAIDMNGDLYNFSDTADNMSGDTLTCNPIDASMYTISDSVWISFFVQGGGNGNTPEFQDSLVLQIRDLTVENETWSSIWSKSGAQMDTFEVVRIKIDSSKYLGDSTQFRFINYFSMEYASMNCDHWNIDYVYFDANRAYNDSLIEEVAYLTNVPNILTQFSSVPWDHFKTFSEQILDQIVYYFRNYSEEIMNLTPYLHWENEYTGESGDVGNIAKNYAPNSTFEESIPINGELFPIDDNDSAKFNVQTTFFISQSDFDGNNTTKRTYDFYNYYAYDDGTAEGMYGVSNKYGMVAVKFKPYKNDELIAIRVYFNKSAHGTDRYFNLMVWDDVGTKPGNVLYKKTRNLPRFVDSINGFVTYELDSSIFVDSVFYIGWQKITDDRLDMGFDKNFVASRKNYFNANAQWEQSQYTGSLMIRPVFGQLFAYKDICKDDEEQEQEVAEEAIIKLFPNPVRDVLKVHVEADSWSTTIYNQVGQLVLSQNNTDYIDMSHFSTGVYFVRITVDENRYTQKIIKR